MYLAKVVGTVVATRKDDRLVGMKLLVVQPLDHREQPSGKTLVAVDSVGAGVGETVLVVSGSSARAAVSAWGNQEEAPVDESIVGIVDTVEG